MSTKQGPLNQHEYLHPYYGQDNCCLCKAEEKVKRLKDVVMKLYNLGMTKKTLRKQLFMIVDEHFWELI